MVNAITACDSCAADSCGWPEGACCYEHEQDPHCHDAASAVHLESHDKLAREIRAGAVVEVHDQDGARAGIVVGRLDGNGGKYPRLEIVTLKRRRTTNDHVPEQTLVGIAHWDDADRSTPYWLAWNTVDHAVGEGL